METDLTVVWPISVFPQSLAHFCRYKVANTPLVELRSSTREVALAELVLVAVFAATSRALLSLAHKRELRVALFHQS